MNKHEWLTQKYPRQGERLERFSTISDMEVAPLYTPEDKNGTDYEQDIGLPGEYPYTRGVYPNMYRGKFWTMRQFAGFGTPEDTNRRFRLLLSEGQNGLSTACVTDLMVGSASGVRHERRPLPR